MIDEQLIKKAQDMPVITDLARAFKGRRKLEVKPNEVSTIRLGGGLAGGLAGGAGGGLAGLLGHYVTAEEEDRKLKDYLRSALLGGGLGTVLGAPALGWASGRFAEELDRLSAEQRA